MKIKIWIILLTIGVAFSSCQKDDNLDLNKKKEQLKVSQRFLRLKQGFTRTRNVVGQNSSNPKLSPIASKQGGLKSSGTETELSDYDYETCANITETTDENGNLVVTMNYGAEGCDDFGMLTKGKIITTYYKQEDSSSPEKIKEEYINYSISYSYCAYIDSLTECTSEEQVEETITMNGITVYESEYNEEWNGNYNFEEDMTYQYSDGEVIVSQAKYKEKQTEESFIITEGKGLYKGKDYEYNYEVIVPVVYKFTCDENIYMPVSGIEKDSYTGKDTEGNNESFEYEIDYGNGDCDNIAKVTENGVTEEIDFDKYYEEETKE